MLEFNFIQKSSSMTIDPTVAGLTIMDNMDNIQHDGVITDSCCSLIDYHRLSI
jgi:hypothetical protein